MLKKAIETKKYVGIRNYSKPYQPRGEIEKLLEKLLEEDVGAKNKKLV